MCLKKYFALLAFAAITLTTAGNVQAVPKSPILLVLPARLRPLQLGFDMLTIKTTVLIAYEQDTRSDDVALHMWNNASEQWVFLSIDDFMHGDFLMRPPRAVYIVGENAAPPKAIADAAAQWQNVEIVESMHIADLVNAFRSAYKFKRRQWYWLQERYGFQINDLNEAVRKFNPYSIPASEVPKELPEIDYSPEDEIPPAILEKR